MPRGAKVVATEEFAAQVTELVSLKTAALDRKLRAAIEAIEAMQRDREKQRANMTEVARRARISRAALAAEMSVDQWLAYCTKHRRDPTLFPDDQLARPRWRPKARVRHDERRPSSRSKARS